MPAFALPPAAHRRRVSDMEVTAMTGRDERAPAAPWRRAIVAVEALLALAAMEGAAQLIAGVGTPPDGQLPLGLASWVLPGLWLLASVGMPSAAAAVLAARRHPAAPGAVLVASALLALELVVQIPYVGTTWLQAACAVIAVAMVAAAASARRRGWPAAPAAGDAPRRAARNGPESPATPADEGVELYWLPLGAGGRSVRFNGRVYEAVAARRAHRATHDLYHSALEVFVSGHRYVIEMAPVWSAGGSDTGAVCEGAVGVRWLRRSRWFRYEVRCWRDGRIPDGAEAVASPQMVTRDGDAARRLLARVRSVPALVWGRDELQLGEMWNSNSVVAWLLTREGLAGAAVLPANGRAPGWDAGVRLAERQLHAAQLPVGSPARVG